MSRTIGLRQLVSPPIISPASRLSFGGALSRLGVGAAASGASPYSDAANAMLAFPFCLEVATTIQKGFLLNGTAGGGASEIGIYDDAFNRLCTTNTFTPAVNSVPTSQAMATVVTLPPGLYYGALAHGATTTGQLFRWSVATIGIGLWQSLGCFRQAAVTPGSPGLPATATPADITTISFPVFGFITRTVFDA